MVRYAIQERRRRRSGGRLPDGKMRIVVLPSRQMIRFNQDASSKPQCLRSSRKP